MYYTKYIRVGTTWRVW